MCFGMKSSILRALGLAPPRSSTKPTRPPPVPVVSDPDDNTEEYAVIGMYIRPFTQFELDIAEALVDEYDSGHLHVFYSLEQHRYFTPRP